MLRVINERLTIRAANDKPINKPDTTRSESLSSFAHLKKKNAAIDINKNESVL